jgi:hypothetical protein
MTPKRREGMCLRLPVPLKDAARRRARSEGRSLTKQIELLLARYVKKPVQRIVL